MATISFVAALKRPVAGTFTLSNMDGDFLAPVDGKDDVDEISLSGPISLFRFLARTEPTPAGIVGFANQFGWLGSERIPESGFELVELAQGPQDHHAKKRGQQSGDLETDQTMFVRTGRAESERLFVVAERLDLWKEEIFRLYDLVTLWELIKTEKNQKLKSRIKWDEKNSIFYQNDTFYRDGIRITSRYEDPRIFEDVRKGLVISAAKSHLIGEINRSLTQISPSLTLEKGRPRVKYVAHLVYPTVWFQFARAIEGNLEFKECVVCGTLFDSNSVRSDKVYCSKKCNMKAHRRRNRKREAKK